MALRAIPALVSALLTAGIALPAEAACFRGVNLSGAEFGDRGGVIDKQYTYPSQRIVDYFRSQGLNTVRLPFLWERLQPVLDQPLDPTELQRLTNAVAMIRKAGMTVILDPHNYATYNDEKIGSTVVSGADFADFWKRLATAFANRDGIAFGLMNEPHDMPADQWLPSANAAIAAIRKSGAKNLILVPGTDWTGAHSWMKVNAPVMIGVADPDHNFAFELHQYLDSNFSGTHTACTRVDDAVGSLEDVTAWLRKTGNRGFLGEFGGSGEPACLKGIAEMVATINDAKDVWTGWTYWVSGDWWPASEPMNITPTKDGDRPQLKALLGPGLSDTSCAGL